MDQTAQILRPARRAAIAPFIAMDVKREATLRAQAGADIIHMEVGEPFAPPPRRVREAAIAALGGQPVGYTDALGLSTLRERIARHYCDAYGVEVDPGRVAVTTGSSGGFVMAFLALFDPGARIAIQNPGYPPYRNIFRTLGLEAVDLPVDSSNGFAVSAAAVEKAHDARQLDGLLLMSPANPSGAMQGAESLREIAELCERRGIVFISDEIYHRLTYDRPAQTALAFSDRAVIVNSFSKYYCMTGWRVGWLVLPPELPRVVERLQQSLAISAPTLSQIAAQAAFDATEELEAVKEGYRRNRDILLDGLPALGLDQLAPADGAFYIYADVSRFTDDSTRLCRDLLHRAGVAATPGVDFDPLRGHLALRLSYAGAESHMVEALKRLKDFLRR
ncbi:aminotransferase class I/II-fold pyridoxal phosphate-dependent enzyme [Rhodoblastus acidophilus]|uniref:aspartate transaminase n=1 Tax=Candidatus Rhodoblastus alkanivorans TaxID=2954117 RepID=A0ABS9Z7H3_9HYPH|nr:aminotransferase class I/II-fold pyridoxal phosphate-dependent enzyme [Candidatus Rhodoblastus alkanivorans]MCI4678361.1 aminotransferase class I/II-fold pyridoxal phosphate-dependent enzyme [Candidatus Rhodoblastus alkanivorans]MCI4683619.1 aminotransferase class I/II-fold pyridoxal phosphate-dependent enzyme [Candidatus Rhodoblastus alkanivorans]MDI4640935.1 aminotransferase class I/II-fold pyridoxal phosphate-dependent enzyme [Rhodoblastus acidophilus]